MDITDIGGAAKLQQDKPKLPPRQNFVPAENYDKPEPNSVPQNPEAKAFRDEHWTIDKIGKDGQVYAGEVDENHTEFLRNTEMID